MISNVNPASAAAPTPRTDVRTETGSGPKAAVNDAPPPAATASATPPVQPAAEARTPLSVDVKQTKDGVFVYTLSDPDTGAVLAVIPRRASDLRSGDALDTHA